MVVIFVSSVVFLLHNTNLEYFFPKSVLSSGVHWW